MWVVSNLLHGIYEVNESAEIRNVVTKKKRKKTLNKRHGRYYLSYQHNGKCYCIKVSRIVAMAFIPNLKNLSDVNHINGDKTDDNACNLEWMSRGDNIRHAIKNGLKPSRKGMHNKPHKPYNVKIRPILQICANSGEVVSEHTGVADAARNTGFDISDISKVVNKAFNRKTVKGYIFKYK